MGIPVLAGCSQLVVGDIDGAHSRLQHREKELLHRARLCTKEAPELGQLLLCRGPLRVQGPGSRIKESKSGNESYR